ncbi:hypothetical protein Lfu02_30770 [Longispora fulva]|uniref:Septum formation-related domain-containing protein n=1 Tax=Longispora fulva TaxID=619741 RepID=A0A8J7GJD8_9ACTN|nr:septum formation family protein [Longispora fulva]MBG6139211.1 hypothetical protein [Longispora fulva]GIG58705.1 hypothetical protein Lfu02_30770 [Longispora fulva]
MANGLNPDDSSVTPVAGECRHAAKAGTPDAGSDGFPAEHTGRRVKCAEPHEMETVYVGVYSTNWTEETGDKEMGEICASRADDYLGGRHQAHRIGLNSYVQAADEMSGKARWFACDVAEIGSAAFPALVTRKSSLRGALATPGPLAITCGDKVAKDYVYRGDCSAPHDLEFAGLFSVASDYHPESRVELDKVVSAGCQKSVTDFLGWDQRTFEENRSLDVTSWGPSVRTVGRGRATYRCFVTTLDNKKLTASVKGLGDKPVPLAG